MEPAAVNRLAWAIAVILIVIVAVGFFYPVLTRNVTRQDPCYENLPSIGRAMLRYEEAHGRLPQSFADLLGVEGVDPRWFVCPKTSDTPATGPTVAELRASFADGGHCSYIFVGRGVPHPNAATPMICEAPGHHPKPVGMVLYADGHVARESNDEIRRILATPPPTPAR